MWGLIKIRDFGTVITGTTPPSKKPEQFGEEYPFITPSDMDRSRKVFTERGISAKGASVHIRKLLPKDSVCFVCIGATIGKICMTTSTSLTNQQINSIIVDKSKHDPFFVYYLLSTYSDNVKSLAGGAATPIINKTSFENIDVNVPPLPIQKAISSILSAYDDLIENNTRRIQILEEMAQRIYTEWFVHFRFPGHEKVGMVDSELGKIPEGWEIVPSSKAIQFNPKITVPKEGEKPFVTMTCLSNSNMQITQVDRRSGNAGSKFQNGDTLFARITPCLENGKIAFVNFLPNKDDVGLGSTEFIVMRSLTLCPEYVYCLARSIDFRENAIKSMAGASGRQRVRNECFDTFMIPNPNLETLLRFQDIVSPMFSMVSLLSKKKNNLRQTRDLILPKLISGEIDVADMPVQEEIAV